MDDPAGDATGLMMLHLWVEQGGRLRVRMTSTIDARTGETTTSYAATRGEVLEQVGDWLDAFVTPGDGPGPIQEAGSDSGEGSRRLPRH